MTSKNETLEIYWQISADYMQAIIDSGDRIDLHHKDLTLKYTDFDRYSKYLSSDVIPMPQKQHLTLHKKNTPHTKNWNKKIGKSVHHTISAQRLSDCIICIEYPNGTTDYAINGNQVAKMLNCTKQLVYQVLSESAKYKSYKTAKGCKLTLIDRSELNNLLK